MPPFPSNKMSRLLKENIQLPFYYTLTQKKILWHNYETLPIVRGNFLGIFHNVETKIYDLFLNAENIILVLIALSFLIRYGQPPVPY